MEGRPKQDGTDTSLSPLPSTLASPALSTPQNDVEISPSSTSQIPQPTSSRSLKRKAPTTNPHSRLPRLLDSTVPPLRTRPSLSPSKSLSKQAFPSISREAEDLPSPDGFLTAENLRHRSKSLSSYSATTVSDTYSDSTVLSFSKFPRPPSGAATTGEAPQEPFDQRLPSTVYSPPLSRFTIDSQHTVIHRGTSFDIINPHASLDAARLNALQKLSQASEEPSSRMDDDLLPPTPKTQPRADSPISSIRSDKDTPRSRAIFDDLPTAHSSILRVTNSQWRISPAGSSSDAGSPHPKALNVRKQPVEESSPVIPSPAMLRSRPTEKSPVEKKADDIADTDDRAPSPTWKDVLQNVFRRRDDSPTPSEKQPIAEERVVSGLHPRPPSRKKNPFTGAVDDQTVPSQSLPVLTTNVYSAVLQPLPVSESDSQIARDSNVDSGAIQTYQEQTERLHRQALFEARAAAANTPEDDEDEQQYDIADSSKRGKTRSGFSQFDFGITGGDARSVQSNQSSIIESPSLNQRRTLPPVSASLQPIASLSPSPNTLDTSGAPIMQRSISSPSEQSSESSSGDSRNIFGILPASQSFVASEGNSSGKASSGALVDLTDKELNAGNRTSLGHPSTSNRPRPGRNSSSRSQSQRRPTSEGLRAAGLEREISRELRRISQISGVSRLSGTVFVLNDGQISASPVDDRMAGSDEENMYDHGGFQSSSSDNIFNRARTINSADSVNRRSRGSEISQGLKPWKGKGKAKTGADDWGSRGSSSGKTNSFLSRLQDDDAANDGAEREWETVSGSRGLDRGQFEPDNSMIRELTGSSLADMSDAGDAGEVVDPARSSFARNLPLQISLSPVTEVLQHSADQRFQHVYRMRELGPEHESVLLPSYNFPGTSSFPNRNALSPPLASGGFVDKTYQHPLPLSDGHVNPFKSSPPLVPSPPRKEIEKAKTQQGNQPYLLRDNGTSVRDFSKATNYDTRQIPSQRQRDSSGPTALERSFSSSVWMDTFGDIGEIGDIGSDIGDEPDMPSDRGSFGKFTTLGPRANITGSPQGTNMRQVGSSLADKSSPGLPWTSSPEYRQSSSPAQPGSSRLLHGNSLTVPESAHLQQNARDGRSPTESGVLYDQIRVHREQLAAEGLLPRPFTPAAKRSSIPRIGSIFGNLSRRPRDPEQGHSDSPDGPSTHLPTPPRPRLGVRRSLIYSQAHLRRHPRFDSDTGLALSRRKQQLSRIVFGLCLLFPPMLLVYGYGMMDPLMVSLSYGEITRFGSTEKRAALILGYGLAVSAVIGIVVSMIVVALSA